MHWRGSKMQHAKWGSEWEGASPTCGTRECDWWVLICDNCCTFFGEKTPNVPPSSRMATPISASRASLLAGRKNIYFFSTNSKIQREDLMACDINKPCVMWQRRLAPTTLNGQTATRLSPAAAEEWVSARGSGGVRWVLVLSRASPTERITERDRMRAGEMRRAGEISETRQRRRG